LRAYLDASVIMPTLVAEPLSPAVDSFMLMDAWERTVSDFGAAEVASVLSRLVRMSVLTSAAAQGKLADFETWRAADTSPVDLQASDAHLAHTYVSRFELKLRAPDALHLAIAKRLGATLVTLDQRLAAAATALGIPVEIPGSA